MRKDSKYKRTALFAKDHTELHGRAGNEEGRMSTFGNYVVTPVFDPREDDALRAAFQRSLIADFDGERIPKQMTFQSLNEANGDLDSSMRIVGLAEIFGLVTLSREDGEAPSNLDEMVITVNGPS